MAVLLRICNVYMLIYVYLYVGSDVGLDDKIKGGSNIWILNLSSHPQQKAALLSVRNQTIGSCYLCGSHDYRCLPS